jgi:hypothetical protein
MALDPKQMAQRRVETVRAQREADQKIVARSRAQYDERMKGHPTPNQEECDRIKLGENIPHKTPSGAGPDPRITRAMEAGGAAPYTTREARAPRTPPSS